MSRPRVLFVGRGRFRFPLGRPRAPVRRALAELDWRAAGDGLDGKPRATRGSCSRVRSASAARRPLYYLRLAATGRPRARRFEPDAVIAQGAQETALALLARRLTRSKTRGDPRSPRRLAAPTRLYGSRPGACSTPFATRSHGLRCDARTRSGRSARTRPSSSGRRASSPRPSSRRSWTSSRSGAPAAAPDAPRALFVGVLERYKAFDVLADAWRRVARRLPEATLHVVGQGALRVVAQQLLEELPDRVEWTPSLTPKESRPRSTPSTLLVLPSRSEGMGRVVVEAAAAAGRRRQPRRRHPGRRLGRRDGSTRPARRRRRVG